MELPDVVHCLDGGLDAADRALVVGHEKLLLKRACLGSVF
jgi:hypothetical protein